jgi:ribose/xylose/arabinose/galactoside ABC-type transport system permease subunit
MPPKSSDNKTNKNYITARQKVSSLFHGILVSDHFVLFLTVFYFFIIWLIYPHMTGRRNIANLSSNMWPLLTLVIGQMFVLFVGGIDLSQTSIMAVTSVMGAMIMTSRLDPAQFDKNPLWNVVLSENGGLLAGSGFAVPVAIIIMLTVGISIGLFNGVAVAKLKMPPFMVTLVSMFFFSGLAIFLTRSENIIHLPKAYIWIGKGTLGFIPFSFFIAFALSAGAYIFLKLTVIGQWFYAVGRNIKASLISGVPTERVVILAYMISGFCAALGSILYSARLEMGSPILGQNLLLDIIGAAVIGGISLFGGKGKLLWAVYGVLFFVVLSNSLNKMPLEFYSIDIIKGGVILLAAVMDVTRTRFVKDRGSINAGF